MLSFLDNWRLAKKMSVAFGLLGALVGVLAFNGYSTNKSLSFVATRHVERGVGTLSALASLVGDIKEQRIIVYSFLNSTDPAEGNKLRDRKEKAEKAVTADIAAIEAIDNDDIADDIAKVKSAASELFTTNDAIFERRASGDMAGALALIKGEGKDKSRALIDQAEDLLKKVRTRSQTANEKGIAAASSSLLMTILLSALTFAGLAGIWYLINSTLAKPMAKLTSATTTLAEGGQAEVPYRARQDELGEIAKAVEQFRMAAVNRAAADARVAAEQETVTATLRDSLSALTEGNLTAEIQADFPPAYAELKTNFNAALGSLRTLIGSVIESSATISTGSGEIAQASEDLARRTEANAASLEETSAAITQIDGRLKASASAATKTVERADGAISTVSGGREIADEAVQAMTRVSESAKGIDSVIEGLDKIAFQTRVLAMNAAVEAGRAGEAGRGFAVVADLVSALAMRAEEEAGRARDQLTATQTDIVTAVEMVQKVDGALANISGDVSEVHALLGQMAADNQAQSTAITQISVAIGTMDQSTQQNAAMVEETSAAARNLSSEVNALADRAGRFTIGEAAHRPAALRATRPAAKPAKAAAKPAASAYVSPVKPLPVAAMANGGGHDDWTSF